MHATGHDWDRRTHQIRLLAEHAASSRTMESWQIAEPHNADALVVRADTVVMRLFHTLAHKYQDTPPPTDRDVFDWQHLNKAARLCLEASQAFPADPMPWVSLLTLARLYGNGHPDTRTWWQEIRARDPYSREAHHQLLRHISARWHGSHGRMYDFARDTATAAPLGSPLAALTQAAHVEHYRERLRTEGKNALGLSFHWVNGMTLYSLNTTFDKWIMHRDAVEYAQDVTDLNLLAHGLVFARLTEKAAIVFRHLGNRATRTPWSYCGDPQTLFIRWRDILQP
ncbi:hypothetical protein [Kitasatospora sp. NPDC088346]|uniref:hypothetical protein n=1 Tax=Kitasatospora sp. NPDC088346 TaxID=3364073 RepID=UPI00380EEFF4